MVPRPAETVPWGRLFGLFRRGLRGGGASEPTSGGGVAGGERGGVDGSFEGSLEVWRALQPSAGRGAPKGSGEIPAVPQEAGAATAPSAAAAAEAAGPSALEVMRRALADAALARFEECFLWPRP